MGVIVSTTQSCKGLNRIICTGLLVLYKEYFGMRIKEEKVCERSLVVPVHPINGTCHHLWYLLLHS